MSRGEEGKRIGGTQVQRSTCVGAACRGAACQRVFADFVHRLVICAGEVFRAALCIGGNAVACVLHHFRGDNEFLHKLNMLDKFAIGLKNGVARCGVALGSGGKDIKLILANDGFAKASAGFHIKEPVANTALLRENIALVLNHHFDGRFKLSDGRIVHTGGLRVNNSGHF